MTEQWNMRHHEGTISLFEDEVASSKPQHGAVTECGQSDYELPSLAWPCNAVSYAGEAAASMRFKVSHNGFSLLCDNDSHGRLLNASKGRSTEIFTEPENIVTNDQYNSVNIGHSAANEEPETMNAETETSEPLSDNAVFSDNVTARGCNNLMSSRKGTPNLQCAKLCGYHRQNKPKRNKSRGGKTIRKTWKWRKNTKKARKRNKKSIRRKPKLRKSRRKKLKKNSKKRRVIKSYIRQNKFWKTHNFHKKNINGEGVTIAILDTGIYKDHRAFVGVEIKDVHNLVDNNEDDLKGHGTACASIVCGQEFTFKHNSGCKIKVPAGVAPKASIVMYKVTNKRNSIKAFRTTNALQKCLQDKDKYGIDIVLLPYACETCDENERAAIKDLFEAGVLLVAAAGNRSNAREEIEIGYPGKLACTICVGSHDKNGKIAQSTRLGKELDFTAPGVDIIAAAVNHPTAIQKVEGTSYAAAHVAGLLALIIQYAKRIATMENFPLRVDVIKSILQKISSIQHKRVRGHGFLTPSIIFKNDEELLNIIIM